MEKRKMSKGWGLCIITLLAAAAVAVIFVPRPPRRVQRVHADVIPGQYGYLGQTFSFQQASDEKWLSQKAAFQDLDELEWLLENNYSYLQLKGVDYQAALDAIRLSVDDRVLRSCFA